jgi:hypothetical protein
VRERLSGGCATLVGSVGSRSTAAISAPTTTKVVDEQPVIDLQVVRQSESCSWLAGVPDSGQSHRLVPSMECEDPDIAAAVSIAVSPRPRSHADTEGAAIARTNAKPVSSEVR